MKPVSQTLFDELGEVEELTNSAPDPFKTTAPKNRANSLDGKSWTRNSISVWSDIRKTSEEIALKHPALFPAALVSRLIDSFTTKGKGIILDPFAGIGTTVIAAKSAGKNGVGIELSAEFAEIATNRSKQVTLLDDESNLGTAVIHHANAFDLLDYIEPESVEMVVTSPPYWDILNRTRTADYKEIRHYGNYDNDLGTIGDYSEFLTALSKVFQLVLISLLPGAYCCIVVMDIRKKDKFYPFHSDIADFMQEIGFIYDDLIIWDRRHEYNNMRPLGYPSVFRINKAHEYILIFKKPNSQVKK